MSQFLYIHQSDSFPPAFWQGQSERTDLFSGSIEGRIDISERHGTPNGHGAGCYVDVNISKSAQVQFEPILEFAKAGAVSVASPSGKKRDIVFTTKKDLKSTAQH